MLNIIAALAELKLIRRVNLRRVIFDELINVIKVNWLNGIILAIADQLRQI